MFDWIKDLWAARRSLNGIVSQFTATAARLDALAKDRNAQADRLRERRSRIAQRIAAATGEAGHAERIAGQIRRLVG